MRALLFPGQGSQVVGMGRSLAEAFPACRETFGQADEALGFPLSKLCFEGPESELTLTANTQPAILTVSVAALRAVEARTGKKAAELAQVAAGHSLGEWSALVASGALAFEDAVRLVRLRGQAMQEAAPAGQGAMAAIIGLDVEAVRAVCEEAAQGQVCSPANLNGGGQIVIAGAKDAVDRAMALAKARKAKLVKALAVSAPFHCALMAPAAERLRAALEGVRVQSLAFPVVTNVEARENRDPARVRELLVRQVTAPVRWEESVERLAELGVTEALELGAGTVLAGMVKRIASTIAVTSVGEAGAVNGLAL